MLDLLQIESFLLVIFRLTSFLHTHDFFLFLEGLVHAFCDVLLLADHVFADLVQFIFSFFFNTLSFL